MIEATTFTPLQAALGGALIGMAAFVLMWSLGKIAGISGLLRSAVFGPDTDRTWKWAFLAGLMISAWLVFRFGGFAFELRHGFPAWQLIGGGLLVGYGTALGSGCTSGHGVCGIARFSLRSMLATALFMVSGIVTAILLRHGLAGELRTRGPDGEALPPGHRETCSVTGWRYEARDTCIVIGRPVWRGPGGFGNEQPEQGA